MRLALTWAQLDSRGCCLVAFTIAEGVDVRDHSFADALWWSAATITTVGYGDIIH